MADEKRPQNELIGDPEKPSQQVVPNDIETKVPLGSEPVVGEASDSDLNEEPDSTVVYAGNLTRKVYSGIWGPYEIAAVMFGSIFLLAAVIFYLLFVVPADRELAMGRVQRDSLEKELQSARLKWGGIQNTETQVAKLLTSAEQFEAISLQDESIGRTAIYQRLNGLINAYRLRNTSGPDYAPLKIGERGAQGGRGNSEKQGRDKLKSLFPGIYVTTTVEGPYTAVRGFIRDIENSREFMAITSVELEPSDEQETKAETQTIEVSDGAGRKSAQRVRKGRYRGNVVSLRIEMAAYFRRPAELRLNTSIEGESMDTGIN